MLGIGDRPGASCTACDPQRTGCDCVGRSARNRQLVRLHKAVLPLRITAWPYAGPVGVRERSDIHVIDQWRFLGTACNEGDVDELLQTRRCAFDRRLYVMLRSALRVLPANAVVELSRAGQDRPTQLSRYPQHQRRRNDLIRHAADPAGESLYPTDGSDEFG
jgi:DNA polymerase-3 subunit epsilon